MPVIQRVSVVSRCTKFFEIGDVNDGKLLEYLKKGGLPQKLSEKYANYVGGINGTIVFCGNESVYDKKIMDLLLGS